MSQISSFTINQTDIQWDTNNGTFTYFGLPAVTFWINPSLRSMLQPLAEEVGYDLFRLQIAASASHGTDEDFNHIVKVLGNSFEEGFIKWGEVVATAGWGHFSLLSYDAEKKRARVKVRNTWELLMQQGLPSRWGCPFIQGKIIGIFSHAFSVTCWADEVACCYDKANSYVEFEIYECTTTISKEIQLTREKQQAEKERLLQEEIRQKTLQLDAARIKAESANYAKSKFIGSMSHELRTPLNAVMGFAELLVNDTSHPLTDEQKIMAQHIHDAGINMLSLVNQVLRFSELRHTSEEIIRQAFSLAPVVTDAIELNLPSAQRRSIAIQNNLQEHQLPMVIGDSDYLKEILLILLSNAVRYIDVQGNINIEAKASPQGTIHLTVSDDGPGVEKDKVPGLFEPFERLDHHAGVISGAGVGLPIAAMLARILGAELGYRANQPSGSVFWLDLPAHTQ